MIAKSKNIVGCCLLCIVGMIATISFAAPAANAADPLKVSTLTDVVDANDGECSLREAIIATNTNTASGAPSGECIAGDLGADSIGFIVSGSIVLGGTQLPAVIEDLTIQAGGAIVLDGADKSRILEVDGADLLIDGLEITNGHTAGDGGGILVDGLLELSNSVVSFNQADGAGGGIGLTFGAHLVLESSEVRNNTGTIGGLGGLAGPYFVTITDSLVRDNIGTGSTGVGGLRISGTLTIIGTTVTGNHGDEAGGIRAAGMNSIESSSITDNTSGVFGVSGLWSFGTLRLTITDSTMSANSGSSSAVRTDSPVTIVNSTLSANLGRATLRSDSTVLHSTFFDNEVVLGSTATLQIGGSILANGSQDAISVPTNFSGILATEGGNVVGDVDSLPPGLNFSQTGDVTGIVDPLLGPLADNGGSTLTHLLLDYSPAVDRVTLALSQNPLFDQRGTARPQGAANDSGAVESTGAFAAVCGGLLATINMRANGGVGIGTSNADVILGTDGDDNIVGDSGDDTICSGPGIDTVRGGPDDDSIFGEGDSDEIFGGGGADIIDGGPGDDLLRGQAGTDTIDGGAGNDDIAGQGAADTLDGGPDNDDIAGQNGADIMTGGSGNDDLTGHTGPDTLMGDDGNDSLTGGNGADTLYGGPGSDRCAGNTGPDQAEAATCETTPGVEVLF